MPTANTMKIDSKTNHTLPIGAEFGAALPSSMM
jgi:hypothetical protein